MRMNASMSRRRFAAMAGLFLSACLLAPRSFAAGPANRDLNQQDVIALVLASAAAGPAKSQPGKPAADPGVTLQVSREIDTLFARWDTTDLPGCTIGVSRSGREIVSRAYGMADLEHGIANRPDSIIEATLFSDGI